MDGKEVRNRGSSWVRFIQGDLAGLGAWVGLTLILAVFCCLPKPAWPDEREMSRMGRATGQDVYPNQSSKTMNLIRSNIIQTFSDLANLALFLLSVFAIGHKFRCNNRLQGHLISQPSKFGGGKLVIYST